METIDWTKAEPIDVEREVRRRLGSLDSPFLDVVHSFVVDHPHSTIPIYTRDIAAVLRDVLPRIKGSNFDASVGFDWDGSGLLKSEPYHRQREFILADWSALDAAPLAICRAFCLMEEST